MSRQSSSCKTQKSYFLSLLFFISSSTRHFFEFLLRTTWVWCSKEVCCWNDVFSLSWEQVLNFFESLVFWREKDTVAFSRSVKLRWISAFTPASDDDNPWCKRVRNGHPSVARNGQWVGNLEKAPWKPINWKKTCIRLAVCCVLAWHG